MLRVGMFLGDRYEILEQIGSGGMADVYKAKCHKLNRLVAIKVLKAEFCNDRNFVSKFKAEAQAAAGLSHPNIVSIYDVGDEDEIHYIVMELVEGITLKQYIEKKKKLDIKESIGITIQIAQGIGAAHEQHIIHRDIKPQNVIISKDGKVKVTDFGIAKAASSQTINSDAVGSVYYFSPEQARGGYCDERSDIYSLGITLYEMLTGRVPFEGESTVAVALAHLQSEMVPPRELEPMIPVSLDKIILKATQKKPERRYVSASELIADLRKALLMPEEDFVKVIPVNNTSPTLLISEDEISKIKQSKSIVINDDDDRPQTTALSSQVDKPVEYEIETDEDGETGEESTTFDKVIFAFGIIICVAILCLAAYFLTQAFKSFGGGAASQESTTAETSEAESTLSAKQTLMPNVVGRSYDEAVKMLKDSNLGVNPQYQSSENVAEGYVIDQEYKEGEVVDKNISVTLYVSSGSNMITLPKDEEMIGQNATNVKRTLSQMGFTVNTETEYSTDYEEGTVIRVSPAGGSKLNKGDTVTVYESLGEKIEYIYVPDLTGKTIEEAEAYLEEQGIVLIIDKENISYEYGDDTKFTKNQIMGQDINVNESVEKGSKIKVTVCKGNQYVDVPSLKGYTEEEAEELLEAVEDAGFSIGKVTEDYDDEVEKGLICSQSVTDKAEIGSKIDVVVSKGKEYTIVPDLSGKNEEEAKKALEEAGLEPGEITEEYSSEVEAGYVLEQSYAKDTELKSGSKVDFVISQGVKTVQLPQTLVGQKYSDMKETLEEEGFIVNATEVEREDVIPGFIVSCNFTAGDVVAYGSVIEFTVAVEPSTTTIAPTEPASEDATESDSETETETEQETVENPSVEAQNEDEQ